MSHDSKSGRNGENHAASNGSGDSTDSETNASSTPENSTPESSDSLKAALDDARKEYLYLRAEFDNYRKQAIKERAELVKYGSERVLSEFLNILDNVDRALETATGPDQFQALKQGFEMIANDFRSILTRFGVQEVPSMGAAFDPSIHEALSSAESETVDPGHIVAVHKKPYKLHDKILRHGQVVVAKPKST